MKSLFYLVLVLLLLKFTIQIQINENQKTIQNIRNIQSEHQTIDQQEQHQIQSESHYLQPSQPEFWYTCILSLVLTLIGAFCSGMGVGFCNIDTLQLQVMQMGKNQQQKKIASTILEVVSDHHLFLTTLLVYNAVALQSLPLVIHKLMPAWAAILFSTFIVLVAAQIVPQAVCTGPKKLIIAYYASPIVNTMRKALFFIIIPIARGLDKLMGTHDHHRIKHKDFATYLTGNKVLKQTQKKLLTATLELRCSRVHQKMIPLRKLYMLEVSQIFTQQKIKQILKLDYSFILVYENKRENIIGFIKVKQFALKFIKSSKQNLKVSDFMQKGSLLSVYKDTNLLEMLMLFESQSVRIALVCDQMKKVASGIPSIMYTKNDMIMKKKNTNIIGAIFLYKIFDEITEFQMKSQVKSKHSNHMPQPKKQIQMKKVDKLKQSLLQK